MKRTIFTLVCAVLFGITSGKAQQKKSQELETFTKLNLEGNIEMHLLKGSKSSIKIETKKSEDLEDLSIKVRNNELVLAYKKIAKHKR